MAAGATAVAIMVACLIACVHGGEETFTSDDGSAARNNLEGMAKIQGGSFTMVSHPQYRRRHRRRRRPLSLCFFPSQPRIMYVCASNCWHVKATGGLINTHA